MTRLTDEELQGLQDERLAVEFTGAWPEYEWVGPPYMQVQQLTREATDFYSAAHRTVPSLLAELRALRAVVLTEEEREALVSLRDFCDLRSRMRGHGDHGLMKRAAVILDRLTGAR